MISDLKFRRLLSAALMVCLLTGVSVGSSLSEEGASEQSETKPQKKEDSNGESGGSDSGDSGSSGSGESGGSGSGESGGSGSGESGDSGSGESGDSGSGDSGTTDPTSTPTTVPTKAPESDPSDPETTPEATEAPEKHSWKDRYMGWYGVNWTDETGMDIPIYYQADWPSTICTIDHLKRSVKSSGCGITCLSMAIAYLTGNEEQNPYSLFVEALNTGCYWGAGWSHAALSEMGERYGVHVQWVGNSSSAIKKALREGKPVIAHMGPGIFCKKGHFVLLKGVSSTGKILMNDPISEYKTHKEFSIYTLLAQARNDCAFGICTTDAMLENEEDSIPVDEENQILEEAVLNAEEAVTPSAGTSEYAEDDSDEADPADFEKLEDDEYADDAEPVEDITVSVSENSAQSFIESASEYIEEVTGDIENYIAANS